MNIYRHAGCVYLDDGVTCLMKERSEVILLGFNPVRGIVLYDGGNYWRETAKEFVKKSTGERSSWLDKLIFEFELADFDEGLMPDEEEWMNELEWNAKDAGFDPCDVQQLMGYQAAIEEKTKLSFGDSDVRGWFEIVGRYDQRSAELLVLAADLRKEIPSWFVRNFLI